MYACFDTKAINMQVVTMHENAAALTVLTVSKNLKMPDTLSKDILNSINALAVTELLCTTAIIDWNLFSSTTTGAGIPQ